MICLEDTWFVAAFHSTPMHDPGLKEFQRPARVCVWIFRVLPQKCAGFDSRIAVRILLCVNFSVRVSDFLIGRLGLPTPEKTGLDYMSSSRALTRAFKCRGWRAPSR